MATSKDGRTSKRPAKSRGRRETRAEPPPSKKISFRATGLAEVDLARLVRLLQRDSARHVSVGHALRWAIHAAVLYADGKLVPVEGHDLAQTDTGGT